MKLAVIAPTFHQADFGSDGIQMMLAHRVKDDPEYVGHFQDRELAGDFIMLDNGAHEGETLAFPELLSICCAVPVHEIAVPDILYNDNATLEQLRHAIHYLNSVEGQTHYQAAGAPRLMIIPQAPTNSNIVAHLTLCAMGMISLLEQAKFPLFKVTLGIPFRYDNYTDFMLVCHRLTWLAVAKGIQVHILGWPSRYGVVFDVAKKYEFIRSIDSAKPITYARQGIALSDSPDHHTMGDIHRGKDYFEAVLSNKELGLAQLNVGYVRDRIHSEDSEISLR